MLFQSILVIILAYIFYTIKNIMKSIKNINKYKKQIKSIQLKINNSN